MNYGYTRAAMNNAIASGDQQAAMRSYAGAGQSRGAGQAFRDRVSGGAARAAAYGQAQQIQDEDAQQSAQLANRLTKMNRQFSLDNRRLAEQRRAGDWDSRFGNLTTAWGALSGLLQ